MELPTIKRTYSRRGSTLNPYNLPATNPKRQKKDILKGAANQPLNTLNKTMPPSSRKQFSGPISIPRAGDADEDGGILEHQGSLTTSNGTKTKAANNRRFGINFLGRRKDSKGKELPSPSLVDNSAMPGPAPNKTVLTTPLPAGSNEARLYVD